MKKIIETDYDKIKTLPKEEKLFLIIKKVNLKTINKNTVRNMISKIYDYLLYNERYEDCALLRDIEKNFYNS